MSSIAATEEEKGGLVFYASSDISTSLGVGEGKEKGGREGGGGGVLVALMRRIGVGERMGGGRLEGFAICDTHARERKRGKKKGKKRVRGRRFCY